MKENRFGDIFSFTVKVSPPVLLVFIDFVFVFFLALPIEDPVGCLLRLLCPFVHLPGSGPEALQVFVPRMRSSSRTYKLLVVKLLSSPGYLSYAGPR